MPGGSTLGNILNTHVSVHTVDIGVSQLSMHSPYETAGAKDTGYMTDALREFYCSKIGFNENDSFTIKRTEKETDKDKWQDISSGRY